MNSTVEQWIMEETTLIRAMWRNSEMGIGSREKRLWVPSDWIGYLRIPASEELSIEQYPIIVHDVQIWKDWMVSLLSGEVFVRNDTILSRPSHCGPLHSVAWLP